MALESRMPSRGELDPRDAAAIVGMACRFPLAGDLEAFWANLRDGVEGILPLTVEELLEARVDASVLADPNHVKAASYLDGVDRFDAAFFGISARDAEVLDPQQRLLLECAWEALECAGYDPRAFPGRIGMFASGRISDYFLYNLSSNPELLATVGPLQTLFANDKDYLATFASFRLDLRGPSLTVQTACSSALVCVHLAAESLFNGESDMALAGSVSLRLPQRSGYVHVEGGILSPDGHCRSFDARAAGTVFGNGAGAVVLKRLDRAIADGDTIQAVVRGSAVNNDGGRKLGFAAPCEDGQAGVIVEALEVAGVDPETIGYVEAHGSATPLGDPIEMAALTQAFREHTARTGFCGVGSVKSNLGHLEAAAGMAGLIKTVLMLRHAEIVPTLHFERLNPEIDLAQSPFWIAAELRPWERQAGRRRAGINSFGLGGTNAHVVVEEAPDPEPPAPSRPLSLLLLSARSPGALRAVRERLQRHLERHPELSLADVAFTSQVGRRAFAHRQAVVAATVAGAVGALAAGNPARIAGVIGEGGERPVAFMFPGVGEHYPGMAGELYRGEEAFRRELDLCASLFQPILGADLRQILYPAGGAAAAGAAVDRAAAPGIDLRSLLRREPRADAAAPDPLGATSVLQPAVFAVEYALARLWMSWNVKPRALIGYSLGEYVAACLSGVLTLEQAVRLVGLRAQLVERLPPGRMLAVPMGEQELGPLLGPGLSLAAVNGEADCVVAGEADAVAGLERQLAGMEIPSLQLPTRHAFHSGMLHAAAAELTAAARQLRLGTPSIPYVSNLTGRWITAEDLRDPGYWSRHMCETVHFAAGIERLLAEAPWAALEVGPGHGLATLALRCTARTDRHLVLGSLRHRDDRGTELEATLTAMGRLWTAGVAVDWQAFHHGRRRRRVPLPTYPFERRRYWVEPRSGGVDTAAAAASASPAAGSWAAWSQLWRQTPAPAAARGPAASSWLLLGDGGGLGPALALRLRDQGRRVTAVTAGPRFARLDRDRYQVSPGRREDYEALLTALAAEGEAPAELVHLWGLGTSPEAPELDLGLHSVTALAQAIGAWERRPPLRLAVVADGLVEVSGRDVPRPLKATVLGVCRVLAQEYPQLRCRVLDVALPAPSAARTAALARLAGRLAAELESAAGEPLVAYRGDRRWLPAFAPLELAAAGPAAAGGAVLITGGLGGLGLALARSWADAVAGVKLVLMGRSPLPDRSQWQAWPHDGVGRKLEQLLALEARGAETLVVNADVADEQQVLAALEVARRRFGRIRGVIHAAGVAGGGLVQLQTRETLTAVLAPKVDGTLVLDRLLAGDDLDFFVVFSSTLATRGGIGQAAYSAANCFLEAFAQARASRARGATVAIAWDRWLEVGMAAVPGEPGSFAGGELAAGLLSSEGIEAFWRVLAAAPPVAVVTKQDFSAVLDEQSGPLDAAEIERRLAALPSPAGGHPRPDVQTAFVAPRNALEMRLAALWEELLGLDRVGVLDNFFALGGDSLRGIQLAARARREGLELTTFALFQHATVAELALRLADAAGGSTAPPVPSNETEPATAAFPLAGLGQDALDRLLAAFGEEE
jgi:phthiocerol/phenolphthiocerol synthesis type-I polyketide synthase E